MYYRKFKKAIQIAGLCVTLALVSSHVYADYRGYLSFDSLFNVSVQYEDAVFHMIDSDDEYKNWYSADLSLNTIFMQNSYAAPLYITGYFGFRVTLPVEMRGDTWAPQLVNDFISSSDFTSCYVVNSNVQFNYDSLVLDYYVFLDNFYTYADTQNIVANTINNLSLTVGLYNSDDPYSGWNIYIMGTPVVTSLGYNYSSSVLPSAISGLGGVISEAIASGLSRSQTASDLATIRNLVDSIKVNDSVFYAQILSALDSQTSSIITALQNLSFDGASIDLDLTSLLQKLDEIKQSDILYYNRILTAFNDYFSLLIENDKDIFKQSKKYWDDKIGQVKYWIQQVDLDLDDMYLYLQDFGQSVLDRLDKLVEGNTEAASDMADSASSQASALDNLADDLSLSVGDVDSVMGDIDVSIVEDSADLWFWLQGKYSYIVYILVLSVSLGLVSFILYGKGGH